MYVVVVYLERLAIDFFLSSSSTGGKRRVRGEEVFFEGLHGYWGGVRGKELEWRTRLSISRES